MQVHCHVERRRKSDREDVRSHSPSLLSEDTILLVLYYVVAVTVRRNFLSSSLVISPRGRMKFLPVSPTSKSVGGCGRDTGTAHFIL